MTTQGIEAQITQISLKIQRQRDVLRNLESNKSLLQQQLNAVRDPIARLPVKITSEIFLQCLPSESSRNLSESDNSRGYPRPKAHLAPLLLLSICHNWTDISLSIPALWASIAIVFPRARGFEHLLEAWLRRARSYPLRISLSGVCDSRVARPILHHSAQLERLFISFRQVTFDEIADGFGFQILGGIQELPLLQQLEIIGTDRVPYCGLSFQHLLSRCPNLVELHMQYLDLNFEERPETLVLPHLRNLTCINNSTAIQWITAPGLEFLASSAEDLSQEALTFFLKQSSPPLRKLRLTQDGNFLYRFDDYMTLLPTVTHLQCVDADSELLAPLFDFLAGNPALLPNLRTLEVNNFLTRAFTGPTDVLNALAHVLSVRHRRLQTVRLTMSKSSAILTNGADLTIFRQFLADGMDIHIGVDDGPNILLATETQEEFVEEDEEDQI
ncbi:hypothetical protein FB45DRAFT_1017347 [Roridomyces roridus]|uniref:F-box domain-containing protein n=1 Tax=Roridomyces roridus TaxID=1738132 RepID=A0AAD7CIQ0_9AGAR|nr:hypothetical protein FB45DRAFT_1017347 [Roridomyces roridus]